MSPSKSPGRLRGERGPTNGTSSLRTRFGFAVAANGLSSVGNLSLTVAIARDVSTPEFGRYSLVILTYAVLTGVLRSAILESSLARRRDKRMEAMGLAEALLYAGVAALGLLALGLSIHEFYVVVLAFSLPGLVAFDYIRVLWLARGDSRRSLCIEIAWTFVTLCGVVLAILGQLGPHSVFAIWAITPSVIALVVVPLWIPFEIASPVRQARLSYGADYLIGAGSTPVAMNLLAITSGLTMVAIIRAASTPMSPINLIASAIRPLAISWFGTGGGSRPYSAFKACIAASLLLSPYILLVLFIPDGLGTALLGETWHLARAVLLPLGLESILGMAISIAFAGHRGLHAARRVIIIRVLFALLRTGTLLIGAAAWGVQGAAWSLPASSLIILIVWWTSWIDLSRRGVAEPRPPVET